MERIPDESTPNRGAARPLVVRIVGSILLLAAVAFLWWRYGSLTPRNNTARIIVATGTIEATEVDVSAEVGGRIEELKVDEGRAVRQGELIARIDDSQTEAEVEGAEAALESARAALEDLKAGARKEELDHARARVELARAKQKLAETDWQRT